VETLTNGGLTAATRSLAIEYAAYGIRVNAISPGRVGQVSDVVDCVLLLEFLARHHGQDLAYRRHPEWAGHEP
jgi:NAD(P)-dependent dehydrogenase (short-subunit alcohol dehydrogenase family)